MKKLYEVGPSRIDSNREKEWQSCNSCIQMRKVAVETWKRDMCGVGVREGRKEDKNFTPIINFQSPPLNMNMSQQMIYRSSRSMVHPQFVNGLVHHTPYLIWCTLELAK